MLFKVMHNTDYDILSVPDDDNDDRINKMSESVLNSCRRVKESLGSEGSFSDDYK